jgi:predicted N-acetyltransferase YhbS
MTDVLIRAALNEDIDAVREVIRAAYANWAKALAVLPDVSGGVAEDVAGGRVWVAVVEGEIVGCLIGGEVSGRWHLANVAVAPEHGGKGVGRDLMTFAVIEARRVGATGMALATHRAMPGNVALYGKLGWRVVAEEGNKIMMHRSTHD